MTILTQTTYTSTGVGINVPLPSSADYMVVQNVTQGATQQATGRGVEFRWIKGVTADDAAIEIKKTNSTDALNQVAVTSGGFTYVTTYPQIEAANANAITAMTAADPVVVSQTNSYSDGDILRIYGTTGMLQFGGLDVEISSSSGSGYTLLGLDGAGLTAGTAGTTRRISKYYAVNPQNLYVTDVTAASSAVVKTSIDPTNYYSVGMKVTFNVPDSFGMVELSGLTGTITALNAADYTMTVDIDSTNFTAFAFPLTTASPTARLFATLAPAGASTTYDPISKVYTGYDFNLQPFRSSEFVPYMHLAAGAQSPAGSSGDVIVVQAYKAS